MKTSRLEIARSCEGVSQSAIEGDARMAALVKYYVEDIRPKKEIELDWFREQPSLAAVIHHASLALDRRQKRFRHQTRIPKVALEAARASLMGGEHELAACKSFAAVFQTVAARVGGISGIGALFVYDTSLRIGAFMGLLPEDVFLHAGTLIGAERLLGQKLKQVILHREDLPAEFAPLASCEIEDFLCIFKDKFGRSVKEG